MKLAQPFKIWFGAGALLLFRFFLAGIIAVVTVEVLGVYRRWHDRLAKLVGE